MPGLPRHLELLWGTAAPGRPGPRRRLTADDIARAGIALADRGGLPAISMNTVATAVGLQTMSLYRYVDNRDALLAIMVDVAVGPADPSGMRGKSWRDRLGHWARDFTARRAAHPWTVEWSPPTPPLGPNGFSWIEAGLTTLDGLPLTDRQKLSVLQLLDGWTQNHVRQSSTMRRLSDPANTDHRYREHIAMLTDPARFPRLAGLESAGLELSEEQYFAEQFDSGLEITLDGIEALMSKRRRTVAPH